MEQQQKRGRKKRGGFNNLQDIIKSQPPEKHFGLPNSEGLSTFKLFPDDLPWQQQNTSSTTTSTTTNNVDLKTQKKMNTPKDEFIQDEDLDNMDLFPTDDTIEYETIYKTQTSSSGHRTLHMSNVQDINDIYRPQQQMTTNNSSSSLLDIGLIPEHLRIVDISKFLKNEVNIDVPTTPTKITKEPELYHPLRVNFYDDSEYKLVQNYKIDDDISWPSRSPFACWWCCHTFDDYPKPIAVKIDGNNIKVMGNCCSWECNKAYSIKNLKTLSLFHTFYYRLFKESSDHIKSAPSPLCTKMFGGTMSIEEYRKSFHNMKRRVSMDVLSNINITVAKTFIYDSKYVQNKIFEKTNKKRKITTES
jgi:hypothetical protein